MTYVDRCVKLIEEATYGSQNRQPIADALTAIKQDNVITTIHFADVDVEAISGMDGYFNLVIDPLYQST